MLATLHGTSHRDPGVFGDRDLLYGHRADEVINALAALVRTVGLGVDAKKGPDQRPDSDDRRLALPPTTPATAACRREAIGSPVESEPWTAIWRPIRPSCSSSLQRRPRTAHPDRSRPGRSRARSCWLGPILAGCVQRPHSRVGWNLSHSGSSDTVRYRLNRGGEWQLNRALTTIVLVRLRRDPATRASAKRRADGRTTKEIIRILKRYMTDTSSASLPKRIRLSRRRPDPPLTPLLLPDSRAPRGQAPACLP